jgi:hypothetical protein
MNDLKQRRHAAGILLAAGTLVIIALVLITR